MLILFRKTSAVSETENPTATVTEEKIQKPAAKTVLNGDSDHSKETEIAKTVDSESKAPTTATNAENSVENAVVGEQAGSETKSDEAKESTDEVAASSTLVEAASKVAEAVSEVAEAALKVAEPEKPTECGAAEKPASSDTGSEKLVEESPSDVADVKSSTAEEKPVSSDSDTKVASSEASVGEAKCQKSGDAVSSSVEAEKPEKGAEKTGELFTDDMVENIEQNYSPTEAGALNLLEMPEDEMFPSEAKPAAESNNAAETTNGTEVAEKTDEKLDIAEAANMFLQGKRNLLVKDYESAANILGEACSKYSAIYGDLGIECAEVYMAYGQALLEWWRVEDSNRKNNDTVEETKGDEEEGVDETQAKENGVEAPQKEAAEDEPMEVEQTDETAPSAENGEETIDETRHEDQAENGEEEEDDEIESEEEVDNLQIAFEILEVAKKIYEKTKDDANLAKVHSKLGEISIASGNLTYALDDLKKALELLTTAAVVDVRHKANVHFQLYIVHTMRCSFPEAEAELRVAKSAFESHLRDLERKLEKTDSSKSSEVDAIAAEIKEIKEVIRDLGEKLVECHKEKRELISAISDVIKTKHSATSADMPSSSSASVDAPSSSAANAASAFSPRKADVPINNISHLVRKKPKNVPEEAKSEPKTEAEKTGEATGAADAKSNGVEAATNDSVGAADAGAEASVKRKAEDVLESEAKKVCT